MAQTQQRNKTNWLALALGTSFTVLLLFAAEGLSRLIYKEPPAEDVKYAKDYFFIDSNGITRAQPSRRYSASSFSGRTGKLIYDVFYTIDEHGSRVTPAPHPELRHKHLLFFGCSFTFGEGLQDGQTYPAQIALRAKTYMPYNYGFHGDSPAEMLAKLESGTLFSEVQKEEGLLIYLFMDAHVPRVAGAMSIAASWGKNRPYYVLGGNGEPRRQGNFTTGRPVLSKIYGILAQSKLLKLLKIDFPPRMTERHIEMTARLIEKSARLYHKQFPKGRFVVVLHPVSFRYGTRLLRYLKAMHLEAYDCRGLFDASRPEYVLSPEDLHPNSLADAELAKQIVKDLKLE